MLNHLEFEGIYKPWNFIIKMKSIMGDGFKNSDEFINGVLQILKITHLVISHVTEYMEYF